MSDIVELERRITAALERIGLGLGQLAAPAPEAAAADAGHEAELATLREMLEAERAARAQLEERLRAIRAREEGELEELRAKVAQMGGQLDAQGLEMQRMRKNVIALRENLRALRETQAAGLAEPHLINKAMQAELDALRATRMTEIVTLDAILAELKPLIREEQDA